MKLMFKRILTFITLLTMVSQPAQGNNLSSFSILDKSQLGLGGNEYFSGKQPGTVLMKVNLWGAVLKPGIHHIPTKTDLITLLSYAGGPSPKAILDEVVIKRDQGKKTSRIKVDVDKLLDEASHHTVQLEPNDIIMIRTRKPLLSNDTVVLIGVIGSIFSIILAGILIDQTRKN